MELHINDVAARTNAGDWLQQCRDGFLESIAVQGYSPATIDVYGRLVRAQCSELTARGLEIASQEAAAAATLGELAPKGSAAKTRALWKSVARRFVRYLCELGILDPSVPEGAPESDDLRHLRVAYEDWLRHQRGLSDETVKNNLQVFNAFMRFRFTDEAIQPDRITPEDLVAFLVPERTDRWTCPDRTKASRLRNLLRFLHWSGRVPVALVETVSRTARRHLTTPRVHLEPGEVRRVLDAVRGDSALARRNYAILLLTGRLGLRAQEVVAIRLEDIRWRAGEILIRGKGNRHDPMPLPVDVGEALVDYIRHGRKGTCRHLFVTARAPWRPFRTGAIVSQVLGDALATAGLRGSQHRHGVHLLRHSLATTMLRQGASFDEIGDVLRHRRRATTLVYARYDLDALRSIAPAWPVPQGDLS